MITNDQLWWHLARASGIVAWVLLSCGVLWGLLLSTRILRDIDRPAWLIDLHRWFGTLTWATTAIHIATLFADSYVQFDVPDLFVPLVSPWKPVAVAWGIVGMYLILVVQVTSRWMKRLPRQVWHAVHLSSYVAFALVTIHAFAAGTDRGHRLFLSLGVALVAVVGVLTIARLGIRFGPTKRSRGVSRAHDFE